MGAVSGWKGIEGKGDNCNSIINKIYLRTKKKKYGEKGKKLENWYAHKV